MKINNSKYTRNDVFLLTIYAGTEITETYYEYKLVVLTGRWKIIINRNTSFLFLEIREKSFWTKYKTKWISEKMLFTIDDNIMMDQEFINDCNKG